MRRITILFFDPKLRNRRDANRIMRATGCDVLIPETFEELERCALEEEVDVYALDLEGHQYLTEKCIELPQVPTIVLSQDNLDTIYPYLSQLKFFTNFIAKGSNNELNNRDLLGTIKKIAYCDVFGLEKYLSWGAFTQTFHIRDSKVRKEYVNHVRDWAIKLGLRRTAIKNLAILTDELLMNAIYDAPTNPRNGKRKHNHKSRTEQVVLPIEEAARLAFACDGRRVAVSVTDPFGSITRDVVLGCLTRCFNERNIDENSESGGAGLGLFFCFQVVNSLIINVDPLQRTEFIGILDIDQSVKESKEAKHQTALHFFNTNNFTSGFIKTTPRRAKKSA